MNTQPLRLGAAGISLMAASALHGQGLRALTEQELDGMDKLSISLAPEVTAVAAEGTAELEKAEAMSKEADRTLNKFLQEASVNIKDAPKPDLTSKVPAPEIEKEVTLPATIKAKEGIYFDSTKGLLVFLDSLVVDHPEFSLTGADEVKVYMEPKEEKKSKSPKPKPEPEPDTGTAPPTEGAAPSEEEPAAAETPAPKPVEKDNGDELGAVNFGEPTTIIATGTIVVERKILKPGDKKARASGRQMVMDLKTDELIIRGGQPWIMSDTANGQVTDPDGYIRLNMKTGDASFVGNSRALIDVNKQNK